MKYVVSNEPLGPDDPPDTIHLRLERDLLRLTLFCHDGEPVGDVEVAFEAGAWKRTLRTDPAGALTVPLPSPRPPEVVVRWTHDGFACSKTYYLDLQPFDSDEGQRRRLANLFFEHGGLRKQLEEELAEHEDGEVGGLDAYREHMQRAIQLLDETGAS